MGRTLSGSFSRHLPETEDIGNMNRLFALTVATLVLSSAASFPLAQQTQKPNANAAVKNPVPATPQSIASGKTLFAKNCASATVKMPRAMDLRRPRELIHLI